MAENIKLITFGESLVTPQHDALINNAELSGNGMFFGGQVNASGTSLNVAHGIGVVYGREFEIENQEIVVTDFPSSGTWNGRLYIQIDLNSDTPIRLVCDVGESFDYTLVDNPQMNHSSEKKTDMLLATFTVNPTSINSDSLVNVCPTIDNAADIIEAFKARFVALESDTGWITFNTAIVYRVKNGIVYMRVRQSGGTMRPHGYSFGTLPASIAPTYSLAEANVYGKGRIFINQNRTVTIEFSDTADKTDYIQASFTYPIG